MLHGDFSVLLASSKQDSENGNTYFTYQYGGVDFIILDTYTHRDEAKQSTILGQTQMEWLQDRLAKSEATFKVLISGSSWSNLSDIHKIPGWLSPAKEMVFSSSSRKTRSTG